MAEQHRETNIRVGKLESVAQDHATRIGKIEGRIGVVITLQVATVAALITLVAKVFSQ